MREKPGPVLWRAGATLVVVGATVLGAVGPGQSAASSWDVEGVKLLGGAAGGWEELWKGLSDIPSSGVWAAGGS